MRRLRRRKDGSVPQRETSGVGAATARLSEMRVRGPPYTAEEMGLVPEGFGLPVGEGVCVSRMEAVGEDIVFFSEGWVGHGAPWSEHGTERTITQVHGHTRLPAPARHV